MARARAAATKLRRGGKVGEVVDVELAVAAGLARGVAFEAGVGLWTWGISKCTVPSAELIPIMGLIYLTTGWYNLDPQYKKHAGEALADSNLPSSPIKFLGAELSKDVSAHAFAGEDRRSVPPFRQTREVVSNKKKSQKFLMSITH